MCGDRFPSNPHRLRVCGMADIPHSTNMFRGVCPSQRRLREFGSVFQHGVSVLVLRLLVERISPRGDLANLGAIFRGKGSMFNYPVNSRKDRLRLRQVLLYMLRRGEGTE